MLIFALSIKQDIWQCCKQQEYSRNCFRTIKKEFRQVKVEGRIIDFSLNESNFYCINGKKANRLISVDAEKRGVDWKRTQPGMGIHENRIKFINLCRKTIFENNHIFKKILLTFIAILFLSNVQT